MDDPALDPNNPNGAGDPAAAVNSGAINTQAGPASAPAVALPSLGRVVHVNFPGGYDGETEAAGIVASVAGDGSLNIFVIPPNGGAAMSLTGVGSLDARNALPSESPDRNLPAWYWPPRQ